MLGIFLEPKGKLKNFIIKWKLRIKKKRLKTDYINHPPHCTIYVSNLNNQRKVIEKIKNITNNSKSFKIKINQTNIFLNDKFTGKDTIYLNINKNKKIFTLQKDLAYNLKNLVNKKKSKNLKLLNKQMKNSFTKFGFPFVGPFWKPHFTIGSIENFKNETDYLTFKKSKVYFEQDVNTISLWKITKNKHKKIKDFKLKT
tara:strand:- start:525 stop:1121 length:597 start_codon:yes stop_codon:yes gene_type:complete